MASVEVSTTIAAPPDELYAMVSDVTRMGEWSPECRRCVWVRGSRGPQAGARFRGYNRKGWRWWWTEAEVVEATPGARFAFDVRSFRLPVARWSYEFRPVDGGAATEVTERWEDRRPGGTVTTVTGIATGVADRAAHNRAGMEQTLARIKAVAEQRG